MALRGFCIWTLHIYIILCIYAFFLDLFLDILGQNGHALSAVRMLVLLFSDFSKDCTKLTSPLLPTYIFYTHTHTHIYQDVAFLTQYLNEHTRCISDLTCWINRLFKIKHSKIMDCFNKYMGQIWTNPNVVLKMYK